MLHKLIIDTDPGIDDAQAIAFALAHPGIELLGLTSVFGNADLGLTTRNALSLLQIFGRPDIPVAMGAAQPLIRERMPSPDFVHGKDGLGNLDLPKPVHTALYESAAEFIVRQANKYPGEVSIVAIGPLTNIAIAVSIDPDLPSKIKSLVVMGGALAEQGNVTPVAEANFINDPHAADKVLAFDWPAVLISLDVTHKVLLTDCHISKLREQAKKTGQFIWDSSRFYADFYMGPKCVRYNEQDKAVDSSSEKSFPMHDASAVVYIIQPDAFTLTKGPVRVIGEGFVEGLLTIDRSNNKNAYASSAWASRPDTCVAIDVNADWVRDTFLETLIKYSIV